MQSQGISTPKRDRKRAGIKEKNHLGEFALTTIQIFRIMWPAATLKGRNRPGVAAG